MQITFSTALAEEFRRAVPFPHVVLDGLFDAALLAEVESEFPPVTGFPWTIMQNEWEYKLANETPKHWGNTTRSVLKYLNSDPFVAQLEKLTGLTRLISDPTFRGGGLHQIPPDGYLKIHTDFNEHNGVFLGKGWNRRLNLLVFLNSDWAESWGGEFEMWSRDGREPVSKVAPVFNRTVIFETSDQSFHGHPHPLRCPPTRTRKSLALYYYSKGKPSSATSTRTRFVPS